MTHIGIIGGGGISDTHARAILEIDGSEIAAFVGHNQEKVTRLADRYDATAYPDLTTFLNHKPMDLVVIGSPSALHAEQGIAAARCGLHVLVEKPLDVNVERAAELIKECQRAAVKLGVCFQDRFAPNVVRLKQLIDDRRLGKPILVSGRVKWYRPPEYYRDSRWRGVPELDGGGALINQAIHTVDLLLYLMGDVRRVYAITATALHEIRSEDTVVATLEFANGALGTLEATTSVYPGYDRRIELTGSEGTIILEQDRIINVDLKIPVTDLVVSAPENRNLSSSSPVVSDVSGHKKILEDFLWAIANDSAPRCDGREGLRSVALVEAIYRSARTGNPVDLNIWPQIHTDETDQTNE
jgi:UDP-N-acetyl-2-amino-2-deoxyglucuronate dehydrogenase